MATVPTYAALDPEDLRDNLTFEMEIFRALIMSCKSHIRDIPDFLKEIRDVPVLP